ncbi:MAG: universal stress protein [Dehalococcoidia bacterium]
MFQRVIVPLDGSPFAEQAIAYAATIAERFEALLTLVRALEGPGDEVRAIARIQIGEGAALDHDTVNTTNAPMSESKRKAYAYLNTVAQSLHSRGLTVETVIEDVPAAGLILEEGRRTPGALIVMSTHGRGGLSRLLFGSTAQRVLEKSPVPILLIRVAEAPLAPAGAGSSGHIRTGT